MYLLLYVLLYTGLISLYTHTWVHFESIFLPYTEVKRMESIPVYGFFEIYPPNSFLSRIVRRILRFIIKTHVKQKLVEISSIISMVEVRKYSIDLVFPDLMGYDLSYMFMWRLVAKFVEKGYDVVKFHSRYHAPEDTYPLECVQLIGYDKIVNITWYFNNVNGHVIIELDEIKELQNYSKEKLY